MNTSGWWTALAKPFEAAQWTIENYRVAIEGQEFGSAFMNSLAMAIPATVIRSRSLRSRHTPSRGWSSGDGT